MLSFESHVKTPWHNVPVVWKLLCVCLCSLLLFVFSSVVVQVFALSGCCLLYLIGGSEFFKLGVRRLYFLWPFLLIIIIWHLLSATVAQGAGIALRLITIVALSNLMTMTSTLTELMDLIKRALMPLRKLGVNTRPVEIAVALVVRFTPVLIGKGAALIDAWRLRSLKKPSWRVVFPISLVAIDDAERVAEALKARGGTVDLTNSKTG